MPPIRSNPREKSSIKKPTRFQPNSDISKPHRAHTLNPSSDQHGASHTDTEISHQGGDSLPPDTPRAISQASNTLYTTSGFEIPPAGIETSCPGISHTEPQWIQARVDEWTYRQGLIGDYETHKRLCARGIDPVAQRAVAGIELSRFVRPTTTSSLIPAGNHISGPQSLFSLGTPTEDLSYSLRNFVTVDPIQDPNVIYARIAVKEGHATAGYVPALPQLRRVVKNEERAGGVMRDREFGEQ